MSETQTLRPLTIHDRCDQCGSQAYIEIGFSTPLLFCGHHYRKHHTAIKEAGVPVTADDLNKIGAER